MWSICSRTTNRMVWPHIGHTLIMVRSREHTERARASSASIRDPRRPSEYSRRPRCERRGASCQARRRGDAPAHRRGGATRQMARRRRNPQGAWGLRPQTASHVVADAPRHRLLRASCLRLARPTRAAHANTRTGAQQPVVKVQLHSTADASRLRRRWALSTMGQILPVFSLLTPCPGATAALVQRGLGATRGFHHGLLASARP